MKLWQMLNDLSTTDFPFYNGLNSNGYPDLLKFVVVNDYQVRNPLTYGSGENFNYLVSYTINIFAPNAVEINSKIDEIVSRLKENGLNNMVLIGASVDPSDETFYGAIEGSYIE